MVFKLVVLACLVAVARGSIIGGPVEAQLVSTPPDYASSSYRFGYNVADSLTGDYKNQEETRDGDVVTGHYSFNEADGTRRIVEYYSNPISGFNALVRHVPVDGVGEPVARFAPRPVVAEPVVAEPVVATRIAAPAPAVRFAAPVAEYAPGPFARYATAGPVPAYTAAYPGYPAPVGAAYATPTVSSAYEYARFGPSAYQVGPVGRLAAAPVYAPSPARFAYAEPVVRAATANFVGPVPAEGFRLP